MQNKKNKTEACCSDHFFKRHHSCHQSNPIYGLGVIGCLFYFLQTATSLGTVLVGIGKAIFWPAILMFKLLTYLQM